MSTYKPPVIKRPIKVLANGSPKIVYRTIKNIHQLRNNTELGIATINRKSYMVRRQGYYWTII